MTALTVETSDVTTRTSDTTTAPAGRRPARAAAWEPLVRWDARLTVEDGPAWNAATPREPSVFGLRREKEVPALLRRLCPESELAPASGEEDGAPQGPSADGRRPTALASDREERRQITAISTIVCQATLETLAGVRPASQLQRWLEPSVWEKVAERAELVRHVRAPLRRSARTAASSSSSRGAEALPTPPSRAVRRIRCDRVGTASWEVSVVLDDGVRTRACAMRLQAHGGRWRVCALELG